MLDGGEALPVVRSTLADKTINGHPVQIKAVPANRIGRDTHILLVTRAAGKSPEELKAENRDPASRTADAPAKHER